KEVIAKQASVLIEKELNKYNRLMVKQYTPLRIFMRHKRRNPQVAQLDNGTTMELRPLVSASQQLLLDDEENPLLTSVNSKSAQAILEEADSDYDDFELTSLV